MANVRCEFTSEWDDGSIVTTPCIYNDETGEVNPEVSKDKIPEGTLLKEYITLEDGEELTVCPDCHEYVLKIRMYYLGFLKYQKGFYYGEWKTVVGDRADLSYGEYGECMNPDCSNGKEYLDEE